MKKGMKLIAGLALVASTTLSLGSCNIAKPDDHEINWDVDLNNKIELKAIFPNSGMSNSEFSNSYSTRLFEEITGYKVQYEQVIDADMGKTINNIFATNEKYHVMKIDPGTYGNNVSQDSFLALDELLEKYGQNLLDIVPDEAWDAARGTDGKIYGIPEVGFSGMISFALVWNMDHLAAVGINEVPDTITEFDTALHALQNKYGGDSYHALAMQGSQADIENLSTAWGLPDDYFVNDNNQVRSYIYHDKYDDYLKYLNGLQRESIISKEWQGFTQSDLIYKFVQGDISCGYIPYWNMNTIYDSIVATQGVSLEEAKEKCGFQLYCLGDGSFGTEVQEEPKYKTKIDTSYFISIPRYMAEDAVYIMDWLNKKIAPEAYDAYVGGQEGVHYDELSAEEVAAGVPEGYVEIKLPTGSVWRKPTDKFNTEILNNSMYATGVNHEYALANWAMRQLQYNSWDILVDANGENAIESPFALAPYLKGWTNIELSARSYVLTLEQSIINANNDATVERGFEMQKTNYEAKYWTTEVDKIVQEWWTSK